GSPPRETVPAALPTVRAAPPAPAVAAAAPAVALPMFRSSVGPITPELADRMTPSSWREGCPVPLEDLRYVTVSHVTFDGSVATGEVVVHADVADAVVEVFASLFAARYPVRSLRLVDDFGGDDDDSMAADNTSAFNCRAITGGTSWSEHAYGRAIDLNPVENPYVLGRHVAPPAGRAFADRPDAPGVIHDDDVVVRAFAAAGWQWGGHWDGPVDYQHFSVSGR
ncbi:M15 family metallopeptidase, partial [Actinotalea ferrariae]|uniref:M15 family metallopeptidase n=1 Tax=Actinotalea ferrariae TaxID=1386098 RepID=UPI001C8C58DC